MKNKSIKYKRFEFLINLLYNAPTYAILFFLLSVVIFIYYPPKTLLYSDWNFVFLFLIFLIVPLLLFWIWSRLFSKAKLGFLVAIILTCIIGVTQELYHHKCEIIELENDGVWTKSVVVKKEYIPQKVKGYWAIKVIYVVENIEYQTKFINLDKNGYSEGDSIDLIYIKSYPKIYRIGFEWSNLTNH